MRNRFSYNYPDLKQIHFEEGAPLTVLEGKNDKNIRSDHRPPAATLANRMIDEARLIGQSNSGIAKRRLYMS